MKTIKILFFVAFAAVAFTACQKEMTDPNGGVQESGEMVTFTGALAQAEVETKTMVYYDKNGYQDEGETIPETLVTRFQDSDKIQVNGVQNTGDLTKLNNSGSEISFVVSDVEAPYYAAVSNQVREWDSESKSYSVTVYGTGSAQSYRAVQSGTSTSYSQQTDILAAYSETESLQFKHLTTFYAITIDKANSSVTDNIKSIYVRQGDGGNIAGSWSLKFDENKVPYLQPNNLRTLVAFSCGDEGLEQGNTMIVGIPSYNYENGLIFTIKDVNGKFASFKIPATKTQHASEGGLIIPFNPKFNPGAGVINSADDWNEFADFVNNPPENDWEIYRWIGDGSNTIKLGKSIEAEDLTPITKEFTYTFDGQGNTITRTNATKALFSTVTGEVKNLTLAGNLALSASGAPLVGTLKEGGKVTGCTNNMKVEAGSSESPIADNIYVSGLVSVAYESEFSSCINNGTVDVYVDVSADSYNVAVGGIVGDVRCETTISLSNCQNTAEADLTLTPKSGSSYTTCMNLCGFGGIAGWLRNKASYVFNNCDNAGDITLSADAITSEQGLKAAPICVGGIIGLGSPYGSSALSVPTKGNGYTIDLDGCDNSGVIHNCGINRSTTSQSHNKVFTGGLAGSLMGDADTYATITSCTNTGNVFTYDLTGDNSSSRPIYCAVAGGFIGFGGYLDMDECVVNCQIGNGKRGSVAWGGMIGFCVRPFKLNNSEIHYSGYFNRIEGYKMNRAVIAVVPVKYDSAAMSIVPDISGSTVTGTLALSGSLNAGKDYLVAADKTDASVNEMAVVLGSESGATGNLTRGQGANANDGLTNTATITYGN